MSHAKTRKSLWLHSNPVLVSARQFAERIHAMDSEAMTIASKSLRAAKSAPAQDVVSRLGNVACKRTRAMAGRIMWWDYYSNSTNSQDTDAFRDFLDERSNPDSIKDVDIVCALVVAGLHPYLATVRIAGYYKPRSKCGITVPQNEQT